MGTVSFYLLRVIGEGHCLTPMVWVVTVGVLRRVITILRTRTTSSFIVKIASCIGTTVTTVYPCALFQNRSEACCVYLIYLIYLSCGFYLPHDADTAFRQSKIRMYVFLHPKKVEVNLWRFIACH